jgi:hypothetical protein
LICGSSHASGTPSWCTAGWTDTHVTWSSALRAPPAPVSTGCNGSSGGIKGDIGYNGLQLCIIAITAQNGTNHPGASEGRLGLATVLRGTSAPRCALLAASRCAASRAGAARTGSRSPRPTQSRSRLPRAPRPRARCWCRTCAQPVSQRRMLERRATSERRRTRRSAAKSRRDTWACGAR